MDNNKDYVENRSKEFGVRVINLYKFLSTEKSERVLSKQILRSGTSIGANVAEAEYAQSKSDFYSKLGIALKEAAETRYWLELLFRTAYISEEQCKSLNDDLEHIIRILVKTVKNKPQI